MDPITRFSLTLWHLLKDLPPLSAERLLAPAVFLCAWTVLSVAGCAGPQAFTMAAVAAQALHLWRAMPETLSRQGRADTRRRSISLWSVSLILAFFALQLALSSPRFAQTLLSLYAAAYAVAMLRGAMKTGAALEEVMPQHSGPRVSDELRQHFCKLYAFCALIVVAVNEATIAAHLPLEQRVAVLSLLPIVMHYGFAIAVMLTCPPFKARD